MSRHPWIDCDIRDQSVIQLSNGIASSWNLTLDKLSASYLGFVRRQLPITVHMTLSYSNEGSRIPGMCNIASQAAHTTTRTQTRAFTLAQIGMSKQVNKDIGRYTDVIYLNANRSLNITVILLKNALCRKKFRNMKYEHATSIFQQQ